MSKTDGSSDDKVGGTAATLLDTSRADRGIWLLKLPPMVASTWKQQSEAGSGLAKLVLTLDPTKPEGENRQFSMELATSGPGVPKTYVLNSTKDVVPMHAFSETTQGKVAMEGKVEHKYDMKPNTFVSDEYRKLCRQRLDKSRIKTRTLQVLENDHGVYIRPQPVAIGPTYTAKKKAAIAKAPEMKRIRMERAELEDMVFKLFEQQPYWTLKNLVVETQQPEAFLKEVMSNLCNYNKRGPNQGKYELKPEYVHKATEEEMPAE